jgi:hypothetical protein
MLVDEAMFAICNYLRSAVRASRKDVETVPHSRYDLLLRGQSAPVAADAMTVPYSLYDLATWRISDLILVHHLYQLVGLMFWRSGVSKGHSSDLHENSGITSSKDEHETRNHPVHPPMEFSSFESHHETIRHTRLTLGLELDPGLKISASMSVIDSRSGCEIDHNPKPTHFFGPQGIFTKYHLNTFIQRSRLLTGPHIRSTALKMSRHHGS